MPAILSLNLPILLIWCQIGDFVENRFWYFSQPQVKTTEVPEMWSTLWSFSVTTGDFVITTVVVWSSFLNLWDNLLTNMAGLTSTRFL